MLISGYSTLCEYLVVDVLLLYTIMSMIPNYVCKNSINAIKQQWSTLSNLLLDSVKNTCKHSHTSPCLLDSHACNSIYCIHKTIYPFHFAVL